MATGDSLPQLVDIMERLLAPNGCPWDREQTLSTLKPYLIEETYEVLDAIDDDHAENHREELGDLLMQIVFQSALRSRAGAFDIDGVVTAISEKMIRRHPHVFGDKKLSSAKQVVEQWSELKRKEKKRRVLDGVPRSMPALARALKLSERAAEVGFDWPDVAGTRAKVAEELEELDRAMQSGDKEAMIHEVGDLLFAIVSLARKLELPQQAEAALQRGCDRFIGRFEFIEDRLAEKNRAPTESSLQEMDALWNEAKTQTPSVTEK